MSTTRAPSSTTPHARTAVSHKANANRQRQPGSSYSVEDIAHELAQGSKLAATQRAKEDQELKRTEVENIKTHRRRSAQLESERLKSELAQNGVEWVEHQKIKEAEEARRKEDLRLKMEIKRSALASIRAEKARVEAWAREMERQETIMASEAKKAFEQAEKAARKAELERRKELALEERKAKEAAKAAAIEEKRREQAEHQAQSRQRELAEQAELQRKREAIRAAGHDRKQFRLAAAKAPFSR